jgi:hypothetical protein
MVIGDTFHYFIYVLTKRSAQEFEMTPWEDPPAHLGESSWKRELTDEEERAEMEQESLFGGIFVD